MSGERAANAESADDRIAERAQGSAVPFSVSVDAFPASHERTSAAKPWADGWQRFTAAVDAARRLPCAARRAVASRNSLRSLRSLRSNSRDESDDEARAARAPTARLRCSAPQRRAASHPPTALRGTRGAARGTGLREPTWLPC